MNNKTDKRSGNVKPEGGKEISRCAFCNSIRENTKVRLSAEDAGESGQASPFTHTICLTCLKNADPELHRMVSTILEEKQAATKGDKKKEKV